MPTPPMKPTRPSTTSSLRCVRLLTRRGSYQPSGWYLTRSTPACRICRSSSRLILPDPCQSRITRTLTPARARSASAAANASRPVPASRCRFPGGPSGGPPDGGQHRGEDPVAVEQGGRAVARDQLRPEQRAHRPAKPGVTDGRSRRDGLADLTFFHHGAAAGAGEQQNQRETKTGRNAVGGHADRERGKPLFGWQGAGTKEHDASPGRDRPPTRPAQPGKTGPERGGRTPRNEVGSAGW